ncbi:hypothetical protein PRZ48_006336 [Zasmidium cellare]|uniref:SCP domain-containing protein n=1 Tax=Zasmidium cellare TaxID=395010 RepID=A0ABR0EMT6_ZASCE|nr:hypothetical protein PRZ48_006336 [Zasmidium cellare]
MGHLIDTLKEKVHHHSSTPSSTTTTKPHITQRNASSPQDSALSTHNFARNTKSLPNVTWDNALAADATAYAQKLADEDNMHHSGVDGQGENLYWSSEGDATFDDAVNMWLKEGDKYHGEKIGEGNLADWGHYTQVMWSGSTHLGMGKAQSKAGGTYIVARYTPQGLRSTVQDPYRCQLSDELSRQHVWREAIQLSRLMGPDESIRRTFGHFETLRGHHLYPSR